VDRDQLAAFSAVLEAITGRLRGIVEAEPSASGLS